MPGAVPRTSTHALTNVTLSYGLQLADQGFEQAIHENEALRRGVNIHAGHICHQGVADAFGLEYSPIQERLSTSIYRLRDIG